MKRNCMTRVSLFLGVLTLVAGGWMALPAGAQDGADAAAASPKTQEKTVISEAAWATLQGKWQAVKGVRNGQEAPAEAVQALKFEFTKEHLVAEGNFGPGSKANCVYKVDETKEPKHFEFLPDEDRADWCLGIYKIENGQLHVCACRAGEGRRPEKFEATPENGFVLLIFDKVKSDSP